MARRVAKWLGLSLSAGVLIYLIGCFFLIGQVIFIHPAQVIGPDCLPLWAAPMGLVTLVADLGVVAVVAALSAPPPAAPRLALAGILLLGVAVLLFGVVGLGVGDAGACSAY